MVRRLAALLFVLAACDPVPTSGGTHHADGGDGGSAALDGGDGGSAADGGGGGDGGSLPDAGGDGGTAWDGGSGHDGGLVPDGGSGGDGGHGGADGGGTGDGGSGADGGASPSVVAWCNQFIPAERAFYERCIGYAPGILKIDSSYFDETITCAELGKAETAGRVKLDAAKAASCLAIVSGTQCDALLRTIPNDCWYPYVGQLSAGQSCYRYEDCSPSTYCDLPSSGCPGTCQPRVATGHDCTGHYGACSIPDVCTYSSGTQLYTCRPYVADGQSCGGPSGLGYCLSDSWCAGETTTAPGICERMPKSGPCAGAGICSSTSYCHDPGGQKICLAKAAVGGSCTETIACPYYSYCGATSQVCTDWPQLGQSCGKVNGNEYVFCVGAYCDGSTANPVGTCRARKAPGSSCSSASWGNECASGSCQSGYCSGTCSEP